MDKQTNESSADPDVHAVAGTSSQFKDSKVFPMSRIFPILLKRLIKLGIRGIVFGPGGDYHQSDHTDIRRFYKRIISRLGTLFLAGIPVQYFLWKHQATTSPKQSFPWTVIAKVAIGTAQAAFGLAAVMFSLLYGSILRLNPPPLQPFCQLSHLPLDPAAKPTSVPDLSPLYPSLSHTSLIEYIPECIYVGQFPLSANGRLMLGARMVIVRLDSNSRDVLVYSPIGLSDEIRRNIDEFGLDIKYIVAPSSVHHCFLGEWNRAYPAAQVIGTQDMAWRRPDINFDHYVNEDWHAPWDENKVAVKIAPIGELFDEIVLFHVDSQTLIVSDLIENLGHAPETEELCNEYSISFWKRWGMTARPMHPTYMSLAKCQNPLGFRDMVLFMLREWDFKRIIVGHGRLIDNDAQEIFKRSFAFVLSDSFVQEMS